MGALSAPRENSGAAALVALDGDVANHEDDEECGGKSTERDRCRLGWIRAARRRRPLIALHAETGPERERGLVGARLGPLVVAIEGTGGLVTREPGSRATDGRSAESMKEEGLHISLRSVARAQDQCDQTVVAPSAGDEAPTKAFWFTIQSS